LKIFKHFSFSSWLKLEYSHESYRCTLIPYSDSGGLYSEEAQ